MTTAGPSAQNLPAVSYVMPVLNEARHLASAVRSVLSQDYPAAQELVLALGPSHDGTTDVAESLVRTDARVVLVQNPAQDIPAGLNRAIEAAHHAIIVRVDAHAELPDGYTLRMVRTLLRTGAANVGGVMEARGRSPFQSSVARVYNSPFGLGGGAYHGGGSEGPDESAYLGCFRKEVLEEVGGYDESMRRGEDYELNQRIIAAGHVVWHVPDVHVLYWPRRSVRDLSLQMWATGAWRGELVRRRRRSTLRYLAAPALVLSLAVGVGSGVAVVAGAPGWVSIGCAGPAAYAVFLAVAAARLGAPRVVDRVRDAGTLATVHVSWGAGFLRGFVVGAHRTVDRSRVATQDGSAQRGPLFSRRRG